ncbi:MAG: hypothetical protein ACLP7J_16280 [Streptosporangiaceae bacterium]
MQESKLPAAAEADAAGDDGLAAGPLDDEAGPADEDEDDEPQATSKIAVPHAMTGIVT